MTCKRCMTGRMFREDEGYTCLMCGYRVEDKPVQPLDIPVGDRPARYRERENGPRIGQMKL